MLASEGHYEVVILILLIITTCHNTPALDKLYDQGQENNIIELEFIMYHDHHR